MGSSALARTVAGAAAFFLAPFAAAADPVDYARDIAPLMERSCLRCHGADKHSAGLRVETGSQLMAGGVSGKLIEAGKASKSYLMARLRGEGGEDRMPIKEDPLSDAELSLVARWIDEGAHVPRDLPSAFSPAPTGLRRLTATQYENAIKDLLGVDLNAKLDQDDASAGFASVGSYKVSTSERGVEQYREAAQRAARAAFADDSRRRQLIGCDATVRTHPCASAFVPRFARLAFRRTPSRRELAPYNKLLAAATQKGGAVFGLELVVAALLQSPHFIYLSETGRVDPEHQDRVSFTGPELATRMAMFLWSSVPDVALLDAAESGRLGTPDGLRAEATRLLESPRARRGVLQFFGEHLELDRLSGIAKDNKVYPQATPSLRRAMREEMVRQIEHLVFDARTDILTMFDTRATFLNLELGKLYGLPAPILATLSTDFKPVALPADGPRAGFLGTGAFLAFNAVATRSSPTVRGVFIREKLLCQEVPPPPPGLDTSLKPPKPGTQEPKTMREKLSQHATNPACVNCHSFFDPLGLSLEQFDGIGNFREKEKGAPLDIKAHLDENSYEGAAALGTLLRKDPRVAACLAKETYAFATGHKPTKGEQPVIAALVDTFARENHDFQKLLIAVISSDGFRFGAVAKNVQATAFSKSTKESLR